MIRKSEILDSLLDVLELLSIEAYYRINHTTPAQQEKLADSVVVWLKEIGLEVVE